MPSPSVRYFFSCRSSPGLRGLSHPGLYVLAVAWHRWIKRDRDNRLESCRVYEDSLVVVGKLPKPERAAFKRRTA